ncbi:MAG: hypothetical protein AAGD38_08550 [Acidobacteriota bacterium]
MLVGDHLYGVDNATLRAVQVEDGGLAWAKRGLGKGSLIAAGDLLYVLGDRGVLALVEARGDGYHEHGRVQAMTGRSWTAPSLADGVLYLRDQDEIVAYDLRSTPADDRHEETGR